MDKKSKRIRRIAMWVLLAFGIGVFILVQVVNRNGLTEWQDPITFIMWVYLILVFIYIIFLNAIPMARNHFKKN